MAATPLAHHDVIAKLVPDRTPGFARVSDDELLANTRRLVGRSNQLLAALLAHLAEVETRGAHRSRRCASLYTYCIYELRFSEDAAARRSAAARFAKEFPALLDAVEAGELHLTGLLMIGPHLTLDNHAAVLARAKYRTKKELTKLVRDLNPLPQVPDCIQPLGAEREPVLSPRNPSWEQFAAALSPQVRELPPAEQPSNWANDGIEHAEGCDPEQESASAASHAAPPPNTDVALPDDETLPVGPVPSDLPPVTSPQLFQMQFGTVEEHVQLVERARALLVRERPRVTLGELHLEAMKLLVAPLEKRKFAVTERPRQPAARPPRQRGTSAQVGESPAARSRQCVAADAVEAASAETPRARSRYVSAAVRREVYRRDAARCTYVDVRGQRCCETRYLELHHLLPFAKGGENAVPNLTLRCASHNALAAEADFGPRPVADRRSSTRHEASPRRGDPRNS